MKKRNIIIRKKTICKLRLVFWGLLFFLFASALTVYALIDMHWAPTANFRADPAFVNALPLNGTLDGNVIETYVIPSLDIATLDITWKSGDFALYPTSEHSIYIVEKSKGKALVSDRLQYAIKDKTLELSDGKRKAFPFSLFGSVETNCELYLPNKIYQSILVQGSNASYKLDGAVAETIQLNVSAGNVRMNNLKAEQLDITSASAILVLANNTANRFNLRMDSGTAHVNGDYKNINVDVLSATMNLDTLTPPESMSVKTVSGTLHIQTQPDCALKCNRETGKITINGEDMEDLSRTYKLGAGGKTYALTAVTGTINFAAE